MIFYLTYNDPPSGIFYSQVIDVVKFMNVNLQAKVKLISFISIRNFFANRRKIKSEYHQAIVLPMFPGVHRWRYNIYLLSLVDWVYKPDKIIGRSVIATQLAFLLKDKNKEVIYDGRGAIASEWTEYGVVKNSYLLSGIKELEKNVISNSQKQIAVSHKLVKFWENEFGIYTKNSLIIPCTLNKVFEQLELSEYSIQKSRQALGIKPNEVLMVYSGSVAGWQSFKLLYNFVKPILLQNSHIKLLFLSDLGSDILKLKNEFNDQVICKKVQPADVPYYLFAADYGLLIREESNTNLVASPVKFAEYLSCGLQVIISDKLGDYSEFVLNNNCGFIYTIPQILLPISFNQKNINRQLALNNFTKENFKSHYQTIINS